MKRRQIEQNFTRLLVEMGVRAERLSTTSRLLHDLGIDGDDAVNFFLALEQRFGRT